MCQGKKIKVFVQANQSAEMIAERLMGQPAGGARWFDLGRIPGDSPEMPRKRRFCKYGRTLFYRYKEVTQIAPKDLVNVIASYARVACEVIL
jgi:hypothetical protein